MGKAGSLCGFFFFFLGERFSIAVIGVQWLWSYTLGNQTLQRLLLDDLEQVMQSSAETSFEI